MSKKPSHFNQGFSLIEMAIVLLIIGLALGMTLNVTRGMRDTQNRQLVQSKLTTLDTALANFVAQNKRLPCPANGTIASGAVNAGIETLSPGPPPAALPPKGSCNPISQINGVIPWVTLGLTESDASDPWNGRMSYRVDPALAGSAPLPLLMNMSNCDPSRIAVGVASTSCAAPILPCTESSGCTSPNDFLLNKGLDVWNGVGGAGGWATRQNNPANGTGAAYVIISHGPSGTGAYNGNGILQPGSIAAGTNETPNRNNRAIAIPSALGTSYRDAQLNDITTAAHFDDYLSHPTIMSVLNKANLGPRAH
ncbi:MAG: type II secretion system protein [Undibacterium sp.]|nr:type II secretion system protein [Undibacterium sp.]